MELVVLRLVLEDLHRDLGDVAQGALVADDDVPDVRAGRAARDVLDTADGAVGEDRLQAHDHVLDRPVQGGELADRARRDEPAHLCERLGLRGVPGRVALGAQRVLEDLELDAAPGGDLHVLFVDLDDLVEARAVEHDRVGDGRLQAALGAGAAGAGHDVDAVLVGEREHLGHVVHAGGVDDRGRMAGRRRSRAPPGTS